MVLTITILIVLALTCLGEGSVRHEPGPPEKGKTVYLARSKKSSEPDNEKLMRVKRSVPDSSAIFFMRNDLEGSHSIMNKRSVEAAEDAGDSLNLEERALHNSKIRGHRQASGPGSLFYLRSLPNSGGRRNVRVPGALNIRERSPRKKNAKSIFYFRRGSQVGYLEGEGVQGGPMVGMGGRKKHGKVSMEDIPLEGTTETPPLLMLGTTKKESGEEGETTQPTAQITEEEEEEGNLAENNSGTGESDTDLEKEEEEKEEEGKEEEEEEEGEEEKEDIPSTGTYFYTTPGYRTPTYFFTTPGGPSSPHEDQELRTLLDWFSSLQGWTVSTINEAIRIFYYLIAANSVEAAECQDEAVNCEVDMCTVAAVASMCKKTCGFCYTAPPPATVAAAEDDVTCVDFDPDFCSVYGKGHCWNADVKNMCRESCAAC